MDKNKAIEYCIQQAKNGQDFGQLRNQLKQLGFDEVETREILRYVDDYLISGAITKTHKSHKREYRLVGWVITLLGFGITFATYTNIIYMGDQFYLAYGAIIGGIALIITNRSK